MRQFEAENRRASPISSRSRAEEWRICDLRQLRRGNWTALDEVDAPPDDTAPVNDASASAAAPRIGYIFERFPSFGQTFCYREVAQLIRQGVQVSVFSIRRPVDEPPQDWDPGIVRQVRYVPEEKELVAEVTRQIRTRQLPARAAEKIAEWGRRSDFLRLYQAAWLGQVLGETGVSRVHAHFAGMAARTAFWVREFFGIPFSFTAHANDIFAPREFEVSLGRMTEAATAVVTVSDFSAAQLQARYPAAAGRIVRVYNGIEMPPKPTKRGEADPPLILAVGRLIEKKGFADLIAACAILRERSCSFRCEIIGDGPLDADLAAQISDLKLADHVSLCGPKKQAEIFARLDAARVFALPCVVEKNGGMDNLPTVIMEAMAAGVPVVSTRIAGVPEMVEPDRTGELVRPNDPPAIADALLPYLNNADLAREHGENGRAMAATKFALHENVRQLAGILTADLASQIAKPA